MGICWRTLPPPDPNIVLPFYWERYQAKTSDLTMCESGGYLALLLHQWQKGFVPATNIAKLGTTMGCTTQTAKQVWKELQGYFRESCPCGCGLVRNRRMEEVRQEQIDNIARSRTNGAKGGRPPKEKPTQNLNHNLNTNLDHNLNESLPSSEIRVPDPVITRSDEKLAVPVLARARPLVESSLHWKHAEHEHGFCDWMCFPVDLCDQFAARIAQQNGTTPLSQRPHVHAWAREIRASGVNPTGKMYDFWNAQWERTHGSSKPVTDGVAGKQARTKERLSRFVEDG
jgi:uncharacterized protein YdaU (DUF1376 family)